MSGHHLLVIIFVQNIAKTYTTIFLQEIMTNCYKLEINLSHKVEHFLLLETGCMIVNLAVHT